MQRAYSTLAIYLLSGLALWLGYRYLPDTPHGLPKGTATLQSGEYHCRLDRVLDGDTIDAHCAAQHIRIRLLYIDAPEMAQSPYGQEAQDYLRKLLRSEKGAFLLRSTGHDVYGRVLGVVQIGNLDANLALVAAGHAVLSRYDPPPAAYLHAEQEARRNAYGIWRTPGAQQNPRQWRRYHQ